MARGERKRMKISKTFVLGASLLTGVLATSGSAIAAETAAGVKEFFSKTIQTTKEAQAAAAEGNKEGCLSAIKQTKQYYKEITGDAAGKPMQDAMKKVNEARDICSNGSPQDAAPILGEAAAAMEKVFTGL